MDWIVALCLSVPLGVAGYVSAAWYAQACHARDAAVEKLRLRTARIVAAATRDAARIEAKARIKAARYQAGAIRVNPKKEEPERKTPFQKWMEVEGRFRSPEIVDACEFAFAFVAGEDSGSEAGESGTAEGARAILDEHAVGWYAAAVEDAKMRR